MKRPALLFASAMGVLLTLGAVLRIIGIRFGLPMAYHNDEWVMVFATRQFFSGDFNPHIFLYPSLLMYIMYGIERIYFLFFSGREDLSTLYVICRMTVVLAGVVSIYVTYELGKRLHDHRAGLVAALALCISPLHVINSHYATTDVPLTLLMLLTLLAVLRLTGDRSQRAYILTGLVFGLTVAIKIPGAVLLVPIVIAHLAGVARTRQLHWGAVLREEAGNRRQIGWALLAAVGIGAAVYLFFRQFEFFARMLQNRFQVELWAKYYQEIISHARAMATKGALVSGVLVFVLIASRRLWWPELHKFLLLAAAAIAAFFLATPYALLDYKTFAHDFLFQMVISQTNWSGMFASYKPGYITHFTYLWNDLGAIPLIMALAGVVLYIRRGTLKNWIILSAFAVYYLYIGSWKLMFDRYMVPVLPLLVVLYAGALVELIDEGLRRLKGPWNSATFIIAVMTGLLVLPGARMLYNSYLFDSYLLKTSTRKLAYDWAVEHLRKDAVVLREQYTPELELAGYKTINVNFTFNDSVTVDYVRRHGVDYIIVCDRLWKRPVQEDGVIGEREAYRKIPKYATLIYRIEPSKPHPGPEIKIFEVNPEYRQRVVIDSSRTPDSHEKLMRIFF